LELVALAKKLIEKLRDTRLHSADLEANEAEAQIRKITKRK
jgi:hypothetical protein